MSTHYTAGGMPLAFTQEDFLVLFCKHLFTPSESKSESKSEKDKKNQKINDKHKKIAFSFAFARCEWDLSIQ